ncbi:hypothetical protein BDZ88DRAFT_36167 [Geranomyces variabilis]|nr:hypothetical protein BDZ88DRAFT_36167 [Geranomyces variabilis]
MAVWRIARDSDPPLSNPPLWQAGPFSAGGGWKDGEAVRRAVRWSWMPLRTVADHAEIDEDANCLLLEGLQSMPTGIVSSGQRRASYYSRVSPPPYYVAARTKCGMDFPSSAGSAKVATLRRGYFSSALRSLLFVSRQRGMRRRALHRGISALSSSHVSHHADVPGFSSFGTGISGRPDGLPYQMRFTAAKPDRMTSWPTPAVGSLIGQGEQAGWTRTTHDSRDRTQRAASQSCLSRTGPHCRCRAIRTALPCRLRRVRWSAPNARQPSTLGLSKRRP